MRVSTKRIDVQLVELAGRNWLASELLRAGIEVARPERDRGIDLIAHIDDRPPIFVARPIQMKASAREAFALYPRYSQFPGIILAYVCNVGAPSQTKCFALTYQEAFEIADAMGWTGTNSWKRGGKRGHPGYSTSQPPARLREMLTPFQMDAETWQQKIRG